MLSLRGGKCPAHRYGGGQTARPSLAHSRQLPAGRGFGRSKPGSQTCCWAISTLVGSLLERRGRHTPGRVRVRATSSIWREMNDGREWSCMKGKTSLPCLPFDLNKNA